MDIKKHLILVKNVDQTEAINYCKYEDGKWQVTFANGQTYTYNSVNVVWERDPLLLEDAVVYEKGLPLSGIDVVQDFDEHIRVIFKNGHKKVYRKSEITLERTCLRNFQANNCFAYLKQLATVTSVKDEDDKSFLSRQYEKIAFVSPRSVLAKYLYPGEFEQSQLNSMMIFPFGFNLSQKKATENALTEQLSVIEGPPGTGKTQTILNIIANAVMNHKTVAVVSGNNSATANVVEKLQKYGVDFIAAYLGNKTNREKFFAGQSNAYPDMTSWVMDEADYKEFEATLEIQGKELEKMLAAKNQAARLKQELSALLLEKEYFQTYYDETYPVIPAYRSFHRHDAETIMSLWINCQQMFARNHRITLISKLKNLIRYGITSFSFYNHPNGEIIALFQKLYYERRAEELSEQIQTLTTQLENYQFDQAMQEYSDISMQLFKARLAERYGNHDVCRSFTGDSLWKENDFENFIREYPVILSTTYSLRSCACANYLFDYVIMDEASQVDIVTGALALSCARNAVIVGDLKQLPNVVSADTGEQTEWIYQNFSMGYAYQYGAANSMLASITKLFKHVPRTLLMEHYRCHPKIIGFCNQKFYNNELIVLTEEENQDRPMAVYKTARGSHARGTYNQRQIDVIMQEIIPALDLEETGQSLGIMSPYLQQTEKLTEDVGENSNIEVDTVHKYQGRERDVVVLTTVVNKVNDFVDQPNLVNVAVSRAVDKLIVVIADNEENENSNIGDLVRYIEYNNFKIINSDVYSVFDLLYHSYSAHLFEEMKNRKKVSAYESENLMNAVIEKVLKKPAFNNLDHVMHQPLRMLIRNTEKLDEVECRYAMNVLTHTDFVIFNKLDKVPVLVVEVEGYGFHANNPKQLERDKMKDDILWRYGIPMLRLKTNESGEEERLQDKLRQIYKETQ